MEQNWEEKLKCFPQIWSRVQSGADARQADAPQPTARLMPGREPKPRTVRFYPR